MNRDDRCSRRIRFSRAARLASSAIRGDYDACAPAPALGVTGSFSPDSQDVLRPRVAALNEPKVLSQGATAAAIEGTGVFWKALYEALEEAGIEVELLHAQHVRQIRGRKTDRNNSIWPARVCQCWLATPSQCPRQKGLSVCRTVNHVSSARSKLGSLSGGLGRSLR